MTFLIRTFISSLASKTLTKKWDFNFCENTLRHTKFLGLVSYYKNVFPCQKLLVLPSLQSIPGHRVEVIFLPTICSCSLPFSPAPVFLPQAFVLLECGSETGSGRKREREREGDRRIDGRRHFNSI